MFKLNLKKIRSQAINRFSQKPPYYGKNGAGFVINRDSIKFEYAGDSFFSVEAVLCLN